jgi:hypothetical protein
MQMMSKVLFAVAVMAVQMSGLVSATECGWFNEVCCDIPDNNPNIGKCLEARNVCWEGKCMKCGTNGMIKCPSTLPSLFFRHTIYVQLFTVASIRSLVMLCC